MHSSYFRITTLFAVYLALLVKLSPIAFADEKLLVNLSDNSKTVIKEERYKYIVSSAEKFINSFAKDKHKIINPPYDNEMRKNGFCFVLQHCPNTPPAGISIGDMSSAQKDSMHSFLAEVTGTAGYHKLQAILDSEALLKPIENLHRDKKHLFYGVNEKGEDWNPGHPREIGRYHIAFFGDVSSSTSWAVRFEGHHLLFYVQFHRDKKDNRIYATYSPMFMGISPHRVLSVDDKHDKELGISDIIGRRALHKEYNLARRLIESLTDKQRNSSKYAEIPGSTLDGGLDKNAKYHEKDGVNYKLLSKLQRQSANDILHEFLEVSARHILDKERLESSLSQANISWSGDYTDPVTAPFYFRMESPEFLIEILSMVAYSSTPLTYNKGHMANHLHTVFRDYRYDWEYDPLKNHVKHYH